MFLCMKILYGHGTFNVCITYPRFVVDLLAEEAGQKLALDVFCVQTERAPAAVCVLSTGCHHPESLTNMSRTSVSPLTVSHKHVSHLSHQSVTLTSQALRYLFEYIVSRE